MKKNKGYSLLEVLLAFTILTLAMLPILSMYPTIFKMSRSAGDNEELARLSLSVVDYIKSRGYTTLLSFDGTNSANNNVDIFDSSETSYTLTETDGVYSDEDFEDDFDIPAGFFLLNSKEGDLEGTTIDIKLTEEFFTIQETPAKGYYSPVSGEFNSSSEFNLEILTTTSDVITNSYIAGTVKLTKGERDYSTSFVVSPLENW